MKSLNLRIHYGRRQLALMSGLSTLCIFVPTALAKGPSESTQAIQSAQYAISANVAQFALRDQGRWDELRDLFQPNGTISVTWYEGSIDGFINASKEIARNTTSQSKHWIGTPRVMVCGNRALSETDIMITARTTVRSIEVDVISNARFFDRFERGIDGVWRILSRTAIYEKDRIDPVAPSILFNLFYRFAGFDKYPPQYKHLAFGLEKNGFKLVKGTIVAFSQEEKALKANAMEWSGCAIGVASKSAR